MRVAAIGLAILFFVGAFFVVFKGVRSSEDNRRLELTTHELVVNLREDLLKNRLQSGGDPDAVDPDGEPVICWASEHPEASGVLRVLLEAGANADTKCGRISVLEAAVRSQNLPGVKLLLRYSTEMNVLELRKLKQNAPSKAIERALEEAIRKAGAPAKES